MLKTIRDLLMKVVDNIDAGNSNITEDQSKDIIILLRDLTDTTEGLSKSSACNYLNVSRATFDNYVRSGELPQGKKKVGFKELRWYKKDLDDFIKSKRNK